MTPNSRCVAMRTLVAVVVCLVSGETPTWGEPLGGGETAGASPSSGLISAPSLVNLPAACTEGRPWDGWEIANAPTALARRCVYPGPWPAGASWSVTYFEPKTASLYRVGGDHGVSLNLASNSTIVLQTRPHPQHKGLSTLFNKTKWPPRTLGTGVFDPIGRRLVYYGGMTTINLLDKTGMVGDTLVLSIDNPTDGWIPLNIDPPGPPRYWAHSVYDPVGHRMVMYGGRSAFSSTVGNETSVLNLAEGAEKWTVLQLPVSPPGKTETIGHGLAYNRVWHAVVLVGGGMAYGGPIAYGHVWTLDLANVSAGWSELQPLNKGPGPGLIGVEVFCSPETGYCYVHSGGIYDPPKSWGSTSPVGFIQSFWRIHQVSEGMFEWSQVRTIAPDSNLLQSRIHWSSDMHQGYSLLGLDFEAGSNTIVERSEEVRIYTLLEDAP